MSEGRGGALRVARAVTVAGTSLAVTAAAHAAAGGRLPDTVGVALLGAVALLAGAAVAGRRLRAVTLVPVLGALQVVLHAGFGFFSTAGTVVPGAVVSGPHAGHGAGHQVALDAAVGAAHAPHTSAGMVAAHVVAVALVAALMLGADAGAHAVVRTLSRVAPLLRRPGTLVLTPARVLVDAVGAVLPRALLVVRDARRRGPPRALPAGC